MKHSNESGTVVDKATRSLKWLFLTEGVTRAISPLTFVVLASLLTPTDYGLVAVAQIVISFSQLFWGAGLEKALIQTNEPTNRAANVVFWSNVGLGLVLFVLVYAAAPAVALFFHSSASLPVIRVLALQIIIGSLTSVQQALFVRDLDFRQLFWTKMAVACLPAFISIPFAFFGFGVWALVGGTLAGSLVNLAILWSKSPWRPSLEFDTGIARRLFGFGVWIVADSLIGWLICYGDGLVVGRFLGMADLGIYRTGVNMVNILFGLTLNPIIPVLFPTFSRLQADLPALTEVLHKANRMIMAVTLPMGIGLTLVATPLVTAIFGDKWHGLGLVLGILALQNTFGWFVGANPEVYRALGRPDVQTKLGVVSLFLFVPLYLLAAPRGLTVFVFARLGFVLASLPLHIYWAVRIVRVSPLYLWQTGRPMFGAGLCMALAVWSGNHALTVWDPAVPAIVVVGFLVSLGAVAYLVSLWLLDRSFVLQAGRLISSVLGRS